ncbi:hypothetical protein DFA_04099 [Cavenderia fasciculata]|uniref:Ankyrin repeat-containing protein n=1 Tax=Cavenderia fasciculata TaxID=261658 RepID=F4Q1A4_CACFS|nr:uncharacterized protein DFA_04099 [Cavenderia fasciculata]EGG18605.1 hypothetical protein DFA_04099 [Cavenderia fasciculata]|eukprot:XP_004366509.1 hypothetical protein DFA_04099 [Cavenderia fasciculata]
MAYAMEYGYLSIIQLITSLNSNISIHDNTMTRVIGEKGNFDILQFIYNNRTERCLPDVIDTAAIRGHEKIVKFLHPFNEKGFSIYGMYGSVGHSLELVEFIDLHRTMEWDDGAMDRAASYGNLDVVKFFHNHKEANRCSELAMDLAAKNGRYDVVKWLHFNRTEGCTTDAMDRAATYDIVKFLHEHRTEGCTKKAIPRAVMMDRLDIIQFLHFNRTEGSTSCALDQAAMRKNFQIVKFLVENRTEECSDSIYEHITGNIEMMKFIYHHCKPKCTKEAINIAARFGHLDAIHFLHEHYNQPWEFWTRAMDMAAMKGHLEIVRFLHFNRTEGCSIDALNNAAQSGNIDLVKFLHYNRTEGCSRNAMDMAAQDGHLEIVKFLHLNRTEGCTHHALEVLHYDVVHYLLVHKCLEPIDFEKHYDNLLFNGFYEILELLKQYR